MNGLAVVTVGSFATEQNFMTCGMVGALERNIHFASSVGEDKVRIKTKPKVKSSRRPPII